MLHIIDGTSPVDMLDQLSLVADENDVIVSIGPRPVHTPTGRAVREIHRPFNWPRLSGLWMLDSARDAAAIHAWSPSAAGAGRTVGLIRERKVLVSLPCAARGRAAGRLIRAVRKGALRVTVPTEAARQHMIGQGAPADAVCVLPPAGLPIKDAAARRERTRGRLGLSDGEFVMVAPSEMTHEAAHRFASWTHAILRRFVPGVRLLLPGGGPVEAHVRRFAASTGYDREILLVGEDMPQADAIAAADVAIFLHERDCGVTALAAALAAGVPVVATNTPDIAECVPKHMVSLLAEPGDLRQASAAVLRVLQDGRLRDRLSRSGANRGRKLFSPARCRRVLERIYAMPQRGPRASDRTETALEASRPGAEARPLTRAGGQPAPLPEDLARGLVFAGNEAETLLQARIGELCRPDLPEWETVKTSPSRTVYHGRIGGQDVYLKHFHRRDRLGRLARRFRTSRAILEMRIGQYLAKHGVPVPEPLAAMCRGQLEWVATRAVADSQPADVWHVKQLSRGQAGRQAIRRATVTLAQMMGRMHLAGVLHGDLHCGNVLVRTRTRGPKLVLMDLHRAGRRRRLSRRARAANLAQLLHDRRELTTRTERLRFLKQYVKAAQSEGSARGWHRMIEGFARRHTGRHHAKRDRRVVAASRYFMKLSLPLGWRGHVVLASKWQVPGSRAAKLVFTPEWWRKVLADPDALCAGKGATVVKDSRSVLIVHRRITVDGRRLDVYVKRPRRKQPWKLLLDCFRPARALRAFRLGHALLTRRLVTAMPLAAVERRIGPFLLDSILITEAVEGPTINQFLSTYLSRPGRGPHQLPERRRPLTLKQQRELAQDVLRLLGRLLQRLHDNNFAHRDLKAGNLLVRWLPGGQPQVVLLDLDGLMRCSVITARRRFKDLMRLNVALLECTAVNRSGRLRMLLGYLRRPGSGRILFKPYWRTLEAMSAQKLRQQIRSRRQRQKGAGRYLG